MNMMNNKNIPVQQDTYWILENRRYVLGSLPRDKCVTFSFSYLSLYALAK